MTIFHEQIYKVNSSPVSLAGGLFVLAGKNTLDQMHFLRNILGIKKIIKNLVNGQIVS